MGKNYYCEYCDKRMKNSVSIRKSHNEGLPHKIAKAEYMARYKDPRDILSEERRKTPCTRFLSGRECKFGLFCHFSHYTNDQLMVLEKIAQQISERTKSAATKVKDAVKKEESEIIFPWTYPYEMVKDMQLPPSLQPYDIQQFKKIMNENRPDWGS